MRVFVQVGVLCAVVFCGCSSQKETPAKTDPQSAVKQFHTLPAFSLTDQTGQTFGSDDLTGKVAVVNFMFTRCPLTCPRQTTKLAELQNRFKQRPGWKNVRLVSISVEPENDTPKVLSDYAKRYSADPEHWKFLTGSRNAIWELSKKGFFLPVNQDAQQPGSVITHSPMFILVADDGKIVGHYDSTSDVAFGSLVKKLDGLVSEQDSAAESAATGAVTHRFWPKGVDKPTWVEKRKADQLATIDKFDVFCRFAFRDGIKSSGITFLNRVVDDAGRDHRPVHYDHGNGVAVADIDNDGLLDIYFVTLAGPNELWRNRGDGRFEKVATKTDMALADRICITASFADVDNDGDADLYVTSVRSPNVLFVNDGTGHFDDVTKSSGLGYNGHSSAATFFDYDRDGDLDVYLSVVGKYTTDKLVTVRGTVKEERPATPSKYYIGLDDAFGGHLREDRAESGRMYRNDGKNHFTDVTKDLGLLNDLWDGDATAIDADDDGWPDLYVLNMQGHDRLYLNKKGKGFVPFDGDSFQKTPWGTMGVKVFDFDNDGKMDLYLTDMHSDMTKNIGPSKEKMKATWVPEKWSENFLRSGGNSIFGNALFRKVASGKFKEVSGWYNAENYWPWGLSVGDLNADGYQDVFVTSSMNYPFRYGVNTVLLNNKGKQFMDAEYIVGVEPRREGRTSKPWYRLDCDSVADRDHPLCDGRSGEVIVHGSVGTRSSAIADFDEDGDLDIVTNEFGDHPMFLINDLTDQKKNLKYLKIRLVGKQSNRDGLGARVIVTADGQTFHQFHDGKSGYLSQSSLPLYFGLSLSKSVEAIDVHWPSGKRQHIDGPIESNRTLTVTEP